MNDAFDVVTVPDFTGKQASSFEARTLLFLASWIENAGQALSFPLHLACIGDPPQSVRWLAAQCGAEITIHQPVEAEQRGTANKLRGLDVRGRTEHVLLVDVDVLTLSDPSSLIEMGSCVAAYPATWPRLPERHWRKIYSILGLELPTERIASLTGELGRTPLRKPLYSEQNFEATRMIPYYNAGVVFAPWNCDMRSVWEEYIRRIMQMFNERDDAWRSVSFSDMAGLAVAVELLRRQGTPFRRLPHVFHTNWLHLYRQAVRLSDVRLFHAHGLYKQMPANSDFERYLFRYRLGLLTKMVVEWGREFAYSFRPATFRRYLLPSLLDCYRLDAVFQSLYTRHVIRALAHSA